MTRILILTAMHERADVSELFCLSARRFIEFWKEKYLITVCALISDRESEELCNRYNIVVIPTPVSPLGTKFNVGLENIMQKFSFDYLLQISDDDVFSPELLEWYEPAILGQIPYFGIKELYFIEAISNRAIHFKYHYPTNKLVGCGRMFLHSAIRRTAYKVQLLCLKTRVHNGVNLVKDKILFIPEYQAQYLDAMRFGKIISGPQFTLWKSDQIRGMDSESEINLVLNNYMPVVVKTNRPLITDIKSDVNIWKFDDLSSFGENVEPSEAQHFWSDQEKAYYRELREKIKLKNK